MLDTSQCRDRLIANEAMLMAEIGLTDALDLRVGGYDALAYGIGSEVVNNSAGALVMQWWTNAVDYPFMISGKPFFGLPAAIPVTFELTVLFSALTTFFGMW